MTKTKWTYDDEVISCEFYLKHRDSSTARAKELAVALNNKFPLTSVRFKLKNYEYLDTAGASGMSNFSFLSKYVYGLKTAKTKGRSFNLARTHTADVANSAVRNILTTISIYMGELTLAQMDATNKFFNYECPYTGRDLSAAIANRMAGIPDSSIEIDHIIPQNRVYCGLNVFGNLVWADSAANSRKGGKKDYKAFLLEDKIIASTSSPAEIQARIDKIEAFQKYSGYDAAAIEQNLKPLLQQYYKDIQDIQLDTAAKFAKAAKL